MSTGKDAYPNERTSGTGRAGESTHGAGCKGQGLGWLSSLSLLGLLLRTMNYELRTIEPEAHQPQAENYELLDTKVLDKLLSGC